MTLDLLYMVSLVGNSTGSTYYLHTQLILLHNPYSSGYNPTGSIYYLHTQLILLHNPYSWGYIPSGWGCPFRLVSALPKVELKSQYIFLIKIGLVNSINIHLRFKILYGGFSSASIEFGTPNMSLICILISKILNISV